MKPVSDRMLHPEYLLVLEDERLYSVWLILETVKAKGIFAATDSPSKAKQRLNLLFNREDFPVRGDGDMKLANGRTTRSYYGARLKACLPEGTVDETARQEWLAKLQRLVQQERAPTIEYRDSLEYLRGLNREQRVENVETRLQSLEGAVVKLTETLDWKRKSAWIRGFERVARSFARLGRWRYAVISAMTLVLAVALVQALRPKTALQIDPAMRNRVAVLSCAKDDSGGGMAAFIAQALEASETLRPVEGVRIRKSPAMVDLCQSPDDQALFALTADLDAHFLLWGEVRQRGEAFEYAGVLFDARVGRRHFRARAPAPFELPDAVARACLDLVGAAEEDLSTAHLRSTQDYANFLYKEAEQVFENGDIRAALPFFRRAVEVHDPDFVMAKIRWAACLYLTGDFPAALEILEGLEEHPRVARDAKLRAELFRWLTRIYEDEGDYLKMEDVLSRARALTRDMPRQFAFFLKKESALAASLGLIDRAEILAEEALRLAAETNDEGLALTAAYNQAQLASLQGDQETALQILDEALAIARLNQVLDEEMDLLAKKSRVLEILEDSESLAEQADILKAFAENARLRGSELNWVKAIYWEGRCRDASGEPERARELLLEAGRVAKELGLLGIELGAKVIIVSDLIGEGNLAEAENLMHSLADREDKFRPDYAMLYVNRRFSIAFSRKNYEEALAYAQDYLDYAERLRDTPAIARGLTRVGACLHWLGRLEEAERHYLAALEKSARNTDVFPEVILENLVILYNDTGKQEEAEKYQNMLKLRRGNK